MKKLLFLTLLFIIPEGSNAEGEKKCKCTGTAKVAKHGRLVEIDVGFQTRDGCWDAIKEKIAENVEEELSHSVDDKIIDYEWGASATSWRWNKEDCES